MKIIFCIITILIFTACSSNQPRERKPFMIVGEKEKTVGGGGGIFLGYGMGSTEFQGSALNTRYKSFTDWSLYTGLGMGIGLGRLSLATGYIYSYNYYFKESKDPNNENRYIDAETFHSYRNKAYISTAYTLYRDKLGNSYGIGFNYYPYISSQFKKVATLPTQELKTKGYGHGSSLFLSMRYASIHVNYRKLIYQSDLSEERVSFGASFGIPLF